MKLNEENLAWALAKLARFSGWRGYPSNNDDLEMRARAFLRLVHNQPLRELVKVDQQYAQICAENGLSVPDIRWEDYGMDPDQLDSDWILDLISETLDYFPLPVQMRSIYARQIKPASNMDGLSARVSE